MRWAAVAVLALCGFGCGPPKPYQGLIPIDHRGLAARMAALCRLGLAPGEAADACKPTAEDKRLPKPGRSRRKSTAGLR